MSKGSSLGMRDAYFEELLKIFRADKNTFFISADNGSPLMDPISELPGQFLNVGIAEQQMVAMACGIALEGRSVWFYAIDPFVSVRVVEFVKLDMCAMNLPITALGVGSGYSYDNMGPTHHAVGDIAVLRPWPNLKIYSPSDNVIAAALARVSYQNRGPQYIKFDRVTPVNLYEDLSEAEITKAINNGLLISRWGTWGSREIGIVRGNDVCIISTGRMVHNAIKIADNLKDAGISVGVVDLFRLKPINEKLLLEVVASYKHIVTYEEDFLIGGLGSAIAEIMIDHGVFKPVLRIGQSDRFVYDLGGRDIIWEKYGLDERSAENKIIMWLNTNH